MELQGTIPQILLLSHMAALPGQILVFHQLPHGAPVTAWSTSYRMEHCVWDSIVAPGPGSVNLSQFTHHPVKHGYSYREG